MRDWQDDEEEEEIPEDLQSLDPAAQQHAIKMRALKMMGIGTLVVLLVSDPAVDVLSSIGDRINIPKFYVAFLLAPLASNASELIAAYKYAAKKTPSSIGVSLSQLEGAGIMNNTFCLAIFFLVIFINGDIAWKFSAETIGIVFAEVVVAFVARKKVLQYVDAWIILSDVDGEDTVKPAGVIKPITTRYSII